MSDVTGIHSIHDGFPVNTGFPHLVVFRDAIGEIDVFSEGMRFRNDSRFGSGGANINFVEYFGPGEIAVRTFERGVENETMACGTGAIAAAIISYIVNMYDKTSYLVHTKGGPLKVKFIHEKDDKFSDIWLEDLAVPVFEGEVWV